MGFGLLADNGVLYHGITKVIDYRLVARYEFHGNAGWHAHLPYGEIAPIPAETAKPFRARKDALRRHTGASHR